MLISEAEIYAKFCSYNCVSGKEYREYKFFIGDIKKLINLIKDEPLSDFEIKSFFPIYKNSFKNLKKLSKKLSKCKKEKDFYRNFIF